MFRISFAFGVLREKVHSPLCLVQERQSSRVRSAKDSFPPMYRHQKDKKAGIKRKAYPSGLVHSFAASTGQEGN